MHVAIFVLAAYAAKATVCIGTIALYQLAAGGYQITLATLDGYTLKITAIFFWIRLYRSIHHQHQTLLTVNYGGKPHTRNVNRRCCARNTPVPTLIFAYNSRKPLPTTQEPEEYGTVNFPMSYIHNFQSGLCPAGLFRRVSSEKHRQNHPP